MESEQWVRQEVSGLNGTGLCEASQHRSCKRYRLQRRYVAPYLIFPSANPEETHPLVDTINQPFLHLGLE